MKIKKSLLIVFFMCSSCLISAFAQKTTIEKIQECFPELPGCGIGSMISSDRQEITYYNGGPLSTLFFYCEFKPGLTAEGARQEVMSNMYCHSPGSVWAGTDDYGRTYISFMAGYPAFYVVGPEHIAIIREPGDYRTLADFGY